MADTWHCAQHANGLNPVVVCQRETLARSLDQIARETMRVATRLHDALTDHLGPAEARQLGDALFAAVEKVDAALEQVSA